MRILALAGVLLVGAGAFVLGGGLRYTTEREVLRVGEFQASVQEEQSVPKWVGAVVLGAGLALVAGGLRRRG